jgi:hypothetical protein
MILANQKALVHLFVHEPYQFLHNPLEICKSESSHILNGAGTFVELFRGGIPSHQHLPATAVTPTSTAHVE